MKVLEREIIKWGRYLFERKLISGWGGNISSRVGGGRFLITGQHAPLGFLTPRDLVEINREGRAIKKKQQPSSETPLHLAVYKGTEARTIIHVHPPAVLAFSLGHRSFVPVSFEEKYTIGEVPILAQETPTVTETEKVVEELRLHPVIILQGHGTVAVGKDLKEAFLLTDLLEEAVHCQFLKNDNSSPRTTEHPVRERGDVCSELPAKAAPQSHGRKSVVRGSPAPDPLSPSFRSPGEKSYVLFSQEHMAAMTDEANSDLEFQNLGRDGGLTTSLTLLSEDSDACWTFHFDQGKITRLEAGGEGEFVISGKREWWEAVFNNRLDPFMATQQGKLRLARGELWKLSRWFKPFRRGFTLWQMIPIR